VSDSSFRAISDGVVGERRIVKAVHILPVYRR